MTPEEGRFGRDAIGNSRIDASAPGAVERAADLILAGGVVAMPTDTVYGIAASMARPDAMRRLYHIKGRPDDKPLPVLLASADDLDQVAAGDSEAIQAFAARFWPGPLTIVAPARAGVPPEATGKDPQGRPTVGVRVPAHAVALDLIRRVGGALAVTSANLSGRPSAASVADIERQVGAACDLILDAGPTPGGVSSTVVAIDAGRLVVLREGPISAATLGAVWRAAR
jgi:L-threonylcarbamoyladenylate synthase